MSAVCQYKEEASRFVDKPSADREVFISIIILRGVLSYEKDISFHHCCSCNCHVYGVHSFSCLQGCAG